MKKYVVIFILGLVIGMLGTSIYHKNKIPEAKAAIHLGYEPKNRLPNFKLETLNGETVQLNDYKNQKVVLNFFASWCPYCQEETPDLIHLQEMHDDLVVLMVNLTLLEDQLEDIETFQKVYDVDLPILIDEKGEMMRNFKIQGTPYNVFLNKDHTIESIIPGGMDYEMLENEINLLQ